MMNTTIDISQFDGRVFGGLTITVGVVDLVCTTFLLGITFFARVRDQMKVCEKLLIYNIVVPDFITGMFLVGIIGPASLSLHWAYSEMVTRWIAYLMTTATFHAHLAVAVICYVIALSMTDVYRFESANNLKCMSALVISLGCISGCMCALPATERGSYIIMANWLAPGFDIFHEYGSAFMCSAMTAIVVPIQIASMIQLLQSRRFFQEHTVRITARAMRDLNKIIGYTSCSMLTYLCLGPAIIGSSVVGTMLGFRLIMHLCPVLRMVALVTLCPHFRFALIGLAGDDMDELAMLGTQENQLMTDDRVADMLTGAFDRMQTTRPRGDSNKIAQ